MAMHVFVRDNTCYYWEKVLTLKYMKIPLNLRKIIFYTTIFKKGHVKNTCREHIVWEYSDSICRSWNQPKSKLWFFFLTHIFLPPSRLYLTCNLIFSSLIWRIKSLQGRNCLYLHLRLEYGVIKLVKNLTTKKLNKERSTFYTIIQEI